jgi:hypothetical protein
VGGLKATTSGVLSDIVATGRAWVIACGRDFVPGLHYVTPERSYVSSENHGNHLCACTRRHAPFQRKSAGLHNIGGDLLHFRAASFGVRVENQKGEKK